MSARGGPREPARSPRETPRNPRRDPRHRVERLSRIERWLTLAEEALLVVLLAFMTGLAFLQVVLRFLNTGLLWGDTLNRHLVLWVGFLGAGLAAARDRQFAIDASARLFTGKTQAAVRLVGHAVASVVSGLLAAAAVQVFLVDYRQPAALFTVAGREVPGWIFEVILPGGFALLCVHYLLKSAAEAAALLGLAPLPSQEQGLP